MCSSSPSGRFWRAHQHQIRRTWSAARFPPAGLHQDRAGVRGRRVRASPWRPDSASTPWPSEPFRHRRGVVALLSPCSVSPRCSDAGAFGPAPFRVAGFCSRVCFVWRRGGNPLHHLEPPGDAELGVYFLAASLTMLPNQMIAAVGCSRGLSDPYSFPAGDRARCLGLPRQPNRHGGWFSGPSTCCSSRSHRESSPRFSYPLGPARCRSSVGCRWPSDGIMFAASAPLLQGLGKPKYAALLYGVFSLDPRRPAWTLLNVSDCSGAESPSVLRSSLPCPPESPFGSAESCPTSLRTRQPMSAFALATAAAGLAAGAIGSQFDGLLGTLGSLLRCLSLGLPRSISSTAEWISGFVEYLSRAFPGVARGSPCCS